MHATTDMTEAVGLSDFMNYLQSLDIDIKSESFHSFQKLNKKTDTRAVCYFIYKDKPHWFASDDRMKTWYQIKGV